MATRQEHDLLGGRDLPAEALHGIHTLRAVENFPLALRPVNPALVHAYGAVKLACARTNRELGLWPEVKADAIEAACEAMMRGELDAHVLVDALQGGAGTATNMNVNEVLANRALQLLDRKPGAYAQVDPLDDLNRHQSTNDTYPTALRVAALQLLQPLEAALVTLLEAFQQQEKALADVVKVGRTQYQDAVLTTLGREMGAYAEAFARDRWRVYKSAERLRVVNLGGTAIGTGIGAPRAFIFQAVEHLRAITGLSLARAENLVEATQNADAFVEVSGILKACAVNLMKTANDLRFLSSGPEAGIGELRLPPRQAGSSIMPGKVNPVIPEAVMQAAMRVMANDQLVAQAAAQGHLELNPFLPVLGDALLDSISLLTRAATLFAERCVAGIEADVEACRRHVLGSTAAATALAGVLGYEQASAVAKAAREHSRTIREEVLAQRLLDAERFDALIAPEQVTRLGNPEIRKT